VSDKFRCAFTLIELLVVIAIIALLLSIMMPALRAARELAYGTVCTSNVRQLSTAWTLYADENDSRMVGAQVSLSDWVSYEWVHRRAQSGDPGFFPGMSAHESELAGIKTGALYPYVKTTKVFHCVADASWKKNKYKASLDAKESPYRSYAIQDGLNGWGYFDQEPVHRITEFKEPARIYVLLEEDEGRGQHNWGSWILDKDGDSFWDPISIWHRKSSTLGYADGHAELHLWKEKTTWQVSTGELPPGTSVPGSEDLKYMQDGYIVR
jgi:prepilin-type N-terminal cleavage/methylation domain-containing protein